MSKRMGRPPMEPAQRQSANINFQTTPKIKWAVESQAATRGVAISEVMRSALVDYLKGSEDQIK